MHFSSIRQWKEHFLHWVGIKGPLWLLEGVLFVGGFVEVWLLLWLGVLDDWLKDKILGAWPKPLAIKQKPKSQYLESDHDLDPKRKQKN